MNLLFPAHRQQVLVVLLLEPGHTLRWLKAQHPKWALERVLARRITIIFIAAYSY
jgi:hypothetical protein